MFAYPCMRRHGVMTLMNITSTRAHLRVAKATRAHHGARKNLRVSTGMLRRMHQRRIVT